MLNNLKSSLFHDIGTVICSYLLTYLLTYVLHGTESLRS